jgi:hypothetical protein
METATGTALSSLMTTTTVPSTQEVHTLLVVASSDALPRLLDRISKGLDMRFISAKSRLDG